MDREDKIDFIYANERSLNRAARQLLLDTVYELEPKLVKTTSGYSMILINVNTSDEMIDLMYEFMNKNTI